MNFSVTPRFFLTHLGARPMLLLAFLAVWAFMLGVSVVQFVLHSDGLLLFNLGPEAAAALVIICIAVTVSIFTWRTMNINLLVDELARKRFFVRTQRTPDTIEWEEIADKLAPLRVSGGLLRHFLGAVRLIPGPNVALSLLLMLLTITLKLLFENLANAPAPSTARLIFVNIPWVVVVFLFSYLLYHDVWSLKELSQQVERCLFPQPVKLEQLRKLFEERLTRTERNCVEKKYTGALRNKEIAAAMNISESSVKTHINNINKKWEQFAANYGPTPALRNIWANHQHDTAKDKL